MTHAYLYSVRRSRGTAGKISQDSQTSLLWLWSRSNSLPFPEALSATTQGFHYRHNQKTSFHQPATQTSPRWEIGFVSVFLCRGCTHDLVWQKGLTQKGQKATRRKRWSLATYEYDHSKRCFNTGPARVNWSIKALHLANTLYTPPSKSRVKEECICKATTTCTLRRQQTTKMGFWLFHSYCAAQMNRNSRRLKIDLKLNKPNLLQFLLSDDVCDYYLFVFCWVQLGRAPEVFMLWWCV